MKIHWNKKLYSIQTIIICNVENMKMFYVFYVLVHCVLCSQCVFVCEGFVFGPGFVINISVPFLV